MKAKERHDIKTDKFLETVAVVQKFLTKHARTILFAVGAVLLVFLAWFGVNWFLEIREESASTAYNEAVGYVDNSMIESGAAAGDLQESVSKLQSVIENHNDTAGAVLAKYRLGLLLLSQGDVSEAKELFKAVIDSRHPMLWSLAAENLGELLFKEGDLEEACRIYRLVADQDQIKDMPTAYFAYKAGLCLEELGELDEALRYYTKAKESGELLHAGLDVDIESKIDELSSTEGESTD